jgi:hypothetical protein
MWYSLIAPKPMFPRIPPLALAPRHTSQQSTAMPDHRASGANLVHPLSEDGPWTAASNGCPWCITSLAHKESATRHAHLVLSPEPWILSNQSCPCWFCSQLFSPWICSHVSATASYASSISTGGGPAESQACWHLGFR